VAPPLPPLTIPNVNKLWRRNCVARGGDGVYAEGQSTEGGHSLD